MTSKSILINESTIKEVGDSKMVDEIDVVSKANSRAWEFRTVFFTSKARLTFAE